MKKIKAFVLGMIEFRSSFTTNYNDQDLLSFYDKGRNLMHRLTLRIYDDTF
jgi:hypothetical protein